ncbi:MAG: ATP-binding protein [Deltaproteobacteria bacterium]|nr:ATP-binding protein [Deltaproteobacteria bacterium]
MYISRLLETTLQKALKTFPATFVGGPRQSGKTTLAKHVLGKTHNYVSLDELDIRSFAVDDPRGFLERYPPPLIIDEIQYAPQLLPYIKARIDESRKPGQWVITGSQQWALMRNISESLAGRVAVLSLYPFALEEMTKNMRLQFAEAISFTKHLTEQKEVHKKSVSHGNWLLNGGYPELFVNRNVSRKLWFSSYVQTYIDRDVRGNLKSAHLNEFEKFIKLLAARTAQVLNYSSLAREIGVTVPTVKAWVSLLEASGIIYLLPPYYRNYGKRLIKSPKCYFMDTGLVCFLVGLQNSEHLLNGPMAGALFETACVTQFIKRFSALVDPCGLYFWRSTDGLEVDLLIEAAETIIPIEIKLSSTINRQHTQALQKWINVSGDSSDIGLILSCSRQFGLVATGIYNCHYSWL